VLDVGCGSGVLTVAAALHGAARVDAVDIDPAATRATAENAARNQVESNVRVSLGSLGEAWPFDSPASARYDVVVANLSSRLVRELSQSIIDALRPGGIALCSGLIVEQEMSCHDALTVAGAVVRDSRRDEDWVLLDVARA
jgi:ribosomal protein L11 methyltransferase